MALPTKLDHCVIHVSDWERSNKFYTQVMGAELVARPVGTRQVGVDARALQIGALPHRDRDDRVEPQLIEVCVGVCVRDAPGGQHHDDHPADR